MKLSNGDSKIPPKSLLARIFSVTNALYRSHFNAIINALFESQDLAAEAKIRYYKPINKLLSRSFAVTIMKLILELRDS
jgi:hypothetical protein